MKKFYLTTELLNDLEDGYTFAVGTVYTENELRHLITLGHIMVPAYSITIHEYKLRRLTGEAVDDLFNPEWKGRIPT